VTDLRVTVAALPDTLSMLVGQRRYCARSVPGIAFVTSARETEDDLGAGYADVVPVSSTLRSSANVKAALSGRRWQRSRGGTVQGSGWADSSCPTGC